MSTEPDREFAELDARLARLPQWQPPPDFAVRLAAAAARQAAEPQVMPRPTGAWLWERTLHHLPLGLGVAAVALVVAVLPWTTFSTSATFVWAIVGCSAAFGLTLTMRVLRAP
jgi:hypothetical protein